MQASCPGIERYIEDISRTAEISLKLLQGERASGYSARLGGRKKGVLSGQLADSVLVPLISAGNGERLVFRVQGEKLQTIGICFNDLRNRGQVEVLNFLHIQAAVEQHQHMLKPLQQAILVQETVQMQDGRRVDIFPPGNRRQYIDISLSRRISGRVEAAQVKTAGAIYPDQVSSEKPIAGWGLP